MRIEVDFTALGDSASGYREAATGVQDLTRDLSAALDQVAAAAANQHVSAGTASLHSGMTAALRALADGSTRHANKVTEAAGRYRAADKLPPSDALAQAGGTPPVVRQAPPARPGVVRYDREVFLREKKRFADMIARMDPAVVARWVTGRPPPPAQLRAVLAEQTRQREAMYAEMRRQGIKVPANLPFKVSDLRTYADQDRIWTEKYFGRFGSPFGKITPTAAAACPGLPEGGAWDFTQKFHRDCWGGLSPEQRQQEILQTSSGPGTSRHHWGTDVDLYDVNNDRFEPGGDLAEAHKWLQENAHKYGFEQTYTATSAAGRLGYTEEKWHWSYVPAAQALQEWAASPAGAQAVDRELSATWGTKEQYRYLRQHYREYMQNVDQTGPLTGPQPRP